MNYVIKILGRANGEYTIVAGTYLKSCDVDGCDGRGSFNTTADIAQALAFGSSYEAVDYYRRCSNIRPVRSDGEPNRPLMAFTVEIMPVLNATV